MPARRKKVRISKIGAARIRDKRAAGKVGRYSTKTPGSSLRDSSGGFVVRRFGGGFVVRGGSPRKRARAGGKARSSASGRAGYGAGGAEGGPVGGIFTFGDPTLARRVEEELYGRVR